MLAVSSSGVDLDEITLREKVPTIAVEMKRHIAPINDLRSLWQLVKLFRREKPDIVHSITPKAGLLSMIAARVAGVPVRIHQFTGLVFPTSSGLKRLILKTTDRLTCSCATHVIAEGQGVRNDLMRNKITAKPVQIIANGSLNGIDLEHFHPQPSVNKNSEAITFVYVGRMVADKGLNELVEAFAQLHAGNPAVRLLLIGEKEENLDPLNEATWEAIASHAAIDYVDFQKDVRPWLAQADILVLPSYREGFPNVVLEAAAMGLPAIVTDINGSNEIVVGGESGFIVNPRDVESLRAGMALAVDKRGNLASMGEKARRRVQSLYDTNLVRKSVIDYYNNFIA